MFNCENVLKWFLVTFFNFDEIDLIIYEIIYRESFELWKVEIQAKFTGFYIEFLIFEIRLMALLEDVLELLGVNVHIVQLWDIVPYVYFS